MNGVIDDESGESMEPMEEVPLEELCESVLERLVHGWGREVDSRDEGKHTGRNDLLYVENAQITPWVTVTTVCFENLLNKNKVIEHVALTNNTTDLKYSLWQYSIFLIKSNA